MLDGTTLELGRSQLTIDARSTLRRWPARHRGLRAQPADRCAGAVDAASPAAPTAALAHAATRRSFSAAIDLPDADIDVQLQRLRLGRTDLEDLAFVARTRDGRLLPSSVTGKVAGAPFTASVELDPAGRAAHGKPRSVRRRHRHRRAAARAGRRRGHRRTRARLAAQRAGARQQPERMGRALGHRRAGIRRQPHRAAARRSARSPRSASTRRASVRWRASRCAARLDGEIDQTPVRIEVTSGTLADFANDASRVPFALTAQAAGAQLTLDGEVSLPLGSGGQLKLRDARRAARFAQRSGAGRTARVGPVVLQQSRSA